MDAYKQNFIEFLLDNGALKTGEYTLKSKRISPYFFNTGSIDSGNELELLGDAYASCIRESIDADSFYTIFGPSYKGVPLAVATSMSLNRKFGINKGYTFDRKEPKGHGDGSPSDIQKNMLVGRKINDGDGIVLVDDVMTTGGTKYDSLRLLRSVADSVRFPGLVIAVDRQEVDDSGKSAIGEFEAGTGVPVFPILKLTEVLDYLSTTGKISESMTGKFRDYIKRYGTEEARSFL